MSKAVESKKIPIVLKLVWIAVLVISFWKVFMLDGNLGWNYQYSSKILGI